MLHPPRDALAIHPSVPQRKGQIVEHRHGVVEHWELKNLGDITRLRGHVGHIPAIEQDPAGARTNQARNDIEQSRFTAARRPQQGIGPAIPPVVIDALDGKPGPIPQVA